MAVFLAPLLIIHVLLICENFLLLLSSITNSLCPSRKGETRGIHIRRKSSVRKKEGLQSQEEEWYPRRRQNPWTAEKVNEGAGNM